MFKFVTHYWKSVSFSLLILYLSLARPATVNDLNIFHATDKLAHYLVYVIFGLILIFDYWRFTNSTQIRNLRFTLYCVFLPIIFGGAIEIIQETWFKPRSAEWIDWLCDIAGILSAVAIMHFLNKKIKFI